MNDPIAQGFEIITRHPSFENWARCHRPGLGLLRPWPSLGGRARHSFVFEFASDLKRLGLFVPFTSVAFGKNHLGFDCTLSAETIVCGVKLRLEESRRFRSDDVDQDRDFRTIVDSSLISFKPSSLNPDAVVIDLSRLLAYLKGPRRGRQRIPIYRKNICAAVETFLTKDKRYLAHRARRLQEKQAEEGRREARFGIRVRFRRKPNSPVIVVLGCVALDWQCVGRGRQCVGRGRQCVGRGLSELWPWLKEQGISLAALGIRVEPRWDNAIAALDCCFGQIRLVMPPPRRVYRRQATAADRARFQDTSAVSVCGPLSLK